MKMTIKKCYIEHFKGIEQRDISFNNNITDVRGHNGSGKSTIATAVYFVLSDSDYQLNNKPMVQPLTNPEVKPHVKLWLDIDGKEITVEKTQKTTIKNDENSGKTTSTTVNTYAINDVPKSHRDFVQYFNDLGVDLEKFLILSHPEAFTKDTSAKGREIIRKALFEMASVKSDLDIAKEMPGIAELTIALGEGYKLDEIKSMNAATIKKIESENGKNNELIESRIQGLIEGKAEIDLTAIAEKEMDIREKIRQTEAEIEYLNTNENDVRIAELENRIKEIELETKAEYYKKRSEHMTIHNELINKYRDVETVINASNKVIFENEKEIEHLNYLLDVARKSYDEIFTSQYDGETICPVCHQELPESMISEAKFAFEQDKTRKLDDLKKSGEKLNKDIDEKEHLIDSARETISRVTPSLEMLKEQIDESSKVDLSEPTLNGIPEVNALQAEINALKAETTDSSAVKLQGLNEFLESLRRDLSEIYAIYNAAENNKAIDSKIQALRDKRIADESTKAKSEKILFEISEFEKYKNNLLTDEINSHFDLVDWRLYEYQKNGEVKPCCYPTYEGKAIDVDTNTALSVAMRLDIASSLQKFNDLYVPIFIDKAESLDAQTRKDITDHTDTQVIWMTVSDCNLEVKNG